MQFAEDDLFMFFGVQPVRIMTLTHAASIMKAAALTASASIRKLLSPPLLVMIAAQAALQRITSSVLSTNLTLNMPSVVFSVSVNISQLKVSNPVVIFDSVFMVNNFVRLKIPANLFFHHESVLVNPSIWSGVGMVSNQHGDVSMGCGCLTALKTWMQFGLLLAKFYVTLPASLKFLSIIFCNFFAAIEALCGWVFLTHKNRVSNLASGVKT
jgi:hypothetical protein